MKKKLNILIVDDEIQLSDIYKSFLEKIEANVTFLDHPQKAWLAIDKNAYDLIITDLKMPVISGDEFISIIRASNLNGQTPVILCSGFINKLVTTETRESKVYFLNKPFSSSELLNLVSKATEVASFDSSINKTLTEDWLQAFSKRLKVLINEDIPFTKENNFEIWNFETIALNLFVLNENEQMSITLCLKLNTFLNLSGKIQGTKYNKIETETLNVWNELIKNTMKNTSAVTFSKLIGLDIITYGKKEQGFYKIKTSFGELQIYLN